MVWVGDGLQDRREPDVKRFHSIEYVDDEGDTVVRHAFMTRQEAEQLLGEFASRGASVTINDLTPEQVDAAAVLLPDGDSPRLEAAPRGRLERH
jgi:hypothetical protein